MLYALATAHARLGQHDAAVDHYGAALNIHLENGDRWYQAATFNKLGDVLHETGRFHESQDAWKHALAIYEEMGAPDAADILAKLERHNRAHRHIPAQSSPEDGTSTLE